MPETTLSRAGNKYSPCAASHSDSLSSHRFGIRPRLSSYLVVLTLIVYCFAVAPIGAGTVKPSSSPTSSWPVSEPLPPAAEDMRQAILSAVHSGNIEELKEAYDLGELRADLGDEPVGDPVAYWKKHSADGEGRELLAILANMMDVGAAQLARGKDPENNAVFVWPYVAELPLDALTPAQRVDLLRLMPAAEAKAMIEKKTWTWWRLTIGADGLWHAFKKGP